MGEGQQQAGNHLGALLSGDFRCAGFQLPFDEDGQMAPVGEREFHAEFAQRGAVVIKPPLQQGLIACDEDRFSRQAGQWNAEAREQGGLSDEEFVSQYAEAVSLDILVTHDRQRCPVQLHIGIQR